MAVKANSKLARLVKLAQKQRDLEKALDDNEAQRKAMNKELEKIAGGYQCEGELPLAMREMELTSFTLDDGSVVSIEDELKPPSMAANSKNRGPLLEWLIEHGHGDAIKASTTVAFAQDDPRKAEVDKALEKIGVPFEYFQTMHPQTLGALLRELVEAGEEIPLDELGVQVYCRAKVKSPKEAKAK